MFFWIWQTCQLDFLAAVPTLWIFLLCLTGSWITHFFMCCVTLLRQLVISSVTACFCHLGGAVRSKHHVKHCERYICGLRLHLGYEHSAKGRSHRDVCVAWRPAFARGHISLVWWRRRCEKEIFKEFVYLSHAIRFFCAVLFDWRSFRMW